MFCAEFREHEEVLQLLRARPEELLDEKFATPLRAGLDEPEEMIRLLKGGTIAGKPLEP